MKDELDVATPDLFLAFARNTDPDTSHEAARSIEGDVTRLEAQVYAAVPSRGDVTLDEVIAATGLDKVTASPRFRPLEEKGLIVRTGKRPGSSGRQQTTWQRKAKG